MQQSNNFNPRKRSIKKLWKGYDECDPYWKDDQLRSMANNICRKEIEAQIKDHDDDLKEIEEYVFYEDW